MQRVFTVSVLALLVVHVIWSSMPFMWFYWHEGKTLETLQLNGLGSLIPVNDFIPTIFLGVYGITCVGLINFQRWARKSLLLWVIASFALRPFTGLYIETGLESFLGSLVVLGNGALLVSIYFTSIRECFDSSPVTPSYSDKNNKVSTLTGISKLSWVAIGIFMVPIDISIAVIFFPSKYYYLSNGYLYSNLFFYSGIIHLILAFMLSRPTRNTYHTQPNEREKRDPFAGLDRYELADHGYGFDYNRSRRNLWEGFFFGVPGGILFLASFFLGS